MGGAPLLRYFLDAYSSKGFWGAFHAFLQIVFIFRSLRLRDKLLYDLVENYTEIAPKLHAKTRHPRRPKLSAARSAAANFARRLCRVFRADLA